MKPNLIKRTKLKEKTDRRLELLELPETGELEICKPADKQRPAKKISFPKETVERYKLPPKKFAAVQNAVEAYQFEDREVKVYADSIESRIGYDSLIRVLGKYFGRQITYFRSEKGGFLTIEEARERAYQSKYDETEAAQLLEKLLSVSSDRIDFAELLHLHRESRVMAENLWEMIKREAQREFESGHRAADVFESADYMKDAWSRASYLGLRESLCEEWKPKGGIELTMIDAVAQAWLQLQFWTEQSVLRSKTEHRAKKITASLNGNNFKKLKQTSSNGRTGIGILLTSANKTPPNTPRRWLIGGRECIFEQSEI